AACAGQNAAALSRTKRAGTQNRAQTWHGMMDERPRVAVHIYRDLGEMRFDFRSCSDGRPPRGGISFIEVVGEARRTVCSLELEGSQTTIGDSWVYGVQPPGPGYRGMECSLLTPGVYTIYVGGAWTGKRDFRVTAVGGIEQLRGTCDKQ